MIKMPLNFFFAAESDEIKKSHNVARLPVKIIFESDKIKKNPICCPVACENNIRSAMSCYVIKEGLGYSWPF